MGLTHSGLGELPNPLIPPSTPGGPAVQHDNTRWPAETTDHKTRWCSPSVPPFHLETERRTVGWTHSINITLLYLLWLWGTMHTGAQGCLEAGSLWGGGAAQTKVKGESKKAYIQMTQMNFAVLPYHLFLKQSLKILGHNQKSTVAVYILNTGWKVKV